MENITPKSVIKSPVFTIPKRALEAYFLELKTKKIYSRFIYSILKIYKLITGKTFQCIMKLYN